jgi:hypothetical protein
VEVAVARDQLCRGDVLGGNRVVRSIRDDGISGGVVVRRGALTFANAAGLNRVR